MQKGIAAVLAALLALGCAHAFAADGMHARYASGTLDAVPPETIGTLNTMPPAALEFHAGSSQFSIPYAEITSFNHREESRWHLGVLATVVVGLLAPWEKDDRVSIVWNDDHGTPEVVTLVLSKEDGAGLRSILETRALKACGGPRPARCGRQTW